VSTYSYEVLERVLHDSFVAEAIGFKTGLSRKEVHKYISEMTADAFIGRAVQRAGQETKSVVAAIAEEMFEPRRT
jgi:hypothetical protein